MCTSTHLTKTLKHTFIFGTHLYPDLPTYTLTYTHRCPPLPMHCSSTHIYLCAAHVLTYTCIQPFICTGILFCTYLAALLISHTPTFMNIQPSPQLIHLHNSHTDTHQYISSPLCILSHTHVSLYRYLCTLLPPSLFTHMYLQVILIHTSTYMPSFIFSHTPDYLCNTYAYMHTEVQRYSLTHSLSHPQR